MEMSRNAFKWGGSYLFFKGVWGEKKQTLRKKLNQATFWVDELFIVKNLNIFYSETIDITS